MMCPAYSYNDLLMVAFDYSYIVDETEVRYAFTYKYGSGEWQYGIFTIEGSPERSEIQHAVEQRLPER